MNDPIGHLDDGVNLSDLHGLDEHIGAASSTDPPQEWIDTASRVLAQRQGNAQLDPMSLLALAKLIYSLYTYFRDNPTARFWVHRAVAHPHGLAAQAFNHKIQQKMPAGLQTAAVSSGIIGVLDSTLVRTA